MIWQEFMFADALYPRDKVGSVALGCCHGNYRQTMQIVMVVMVIIGFLG